MGRTVLVLAGILIAGVMASCGGGDGKSASRKPLDAAGVLDVNKASIVKVTATGPGGTGWGSGIIWEDSGHVLTNAHVVIGAGAVKVVDPADGSRTYPAKVVALSACDDVALLSIERATNLKPVKAADSDGVKLGDHVIALGYPDTISNGPASPILTEGNVSRIKATFPYGGQRDLVQHTAPINPGNSGGPLFNVYGEVIGLNSYTAIGKQAENYAISMNEAKAVAEKLKAGKNLDYIGISLTVNSRDYAIENDLAYIDGLAVTGVDPGSPADKAKPESIFVGDLVFEVNGTSVETVGQFCDIIRSHHSGDTLRLRIGAYDTEGKAYSNFQEDVVLP